MLRILYLFILVGVMACSKEPSSQDDETLIQEYITKNNLTTQVDRGVHYIIQAEGSVEKPSIVNQVTVNYKGYYTDGVIFDSSYDLGVPATFPLSNVIEGWQIGIPKFGKDGKGMLIIPSRSGYGSNPPFGVRANAILIFEIEVLDFK
ncbi:MAG: FKBP-type peptidyl-prolyl cis-trans isomerase [Saprospiraceae bacterium]|nr:FKBP-type peptidyl-prolyl cis-trans isomerase [Saprospiraceae bacterium]